MRSKWKGVFVDPILLSRVENAAESPIKVFSRGSTILPAFLGKRFLIYNGKTFDLLRITSDMFFHKFGEYSLTKKIGYFIHTSKFKRKKKKKRGKK
jgi:small subunit ribosomal protein S19